MDGVQDDPFLWDVEAVARELGALNQTWTREPTALIAKVKGEEIDGQTLLTFEHICSRQELMECLGVKLLRHKAALGQAIINLRARSQGYQNWRRDFVQKQCGPIAATELIPQPGAAVQPEAQAVAQVLPQVPSLELNTPIPPTMNSTSEVTSPANVPVAPIPLRGKATEVVNANESDERPAKRKRIVPANLSETPSGTTAAFIPTQADFLGHIVNDEQTVQEEGFPWEEASRDAYLGRGRILIESIKNPSNTLSSRLFETGSGTFGVLLPNHVPDGRRLAVHRAMRSLLRRNGAKEAIYRAGFAIERSSSPSEVDTVLDLCDLPDSYDEQTTREIEDEMRDRKSLLESKKYLSEIRVGEIIDEEVKEMTSLWQTKKLPQKQCKAFTLWNQAHKKGTRREKIEAAQMRAKLYDVRIHKLRKGILDERWAKDSHVRTQARSLEQSIEDKLHNLWLAQMLESRIPPPKLEVATKQKLKRQVVDDEEILTSSDEDDFIVPDLEELITGAEPMDTTVYQSPDDVRDEYAEEDTPMFMDLTEMDVSEELSSDSKIRSFVDLTTPTESQIPIHNTSHVDADNQLESQVDNPDFSNLPDMDKFEDFGGMAQLGVRHWASKGDQWRVAICLIWALPHVRRLAILGCIEQNGPTIVWNRTIRTHIEDPLTDLSQLGHELEKTLELDLTRVFLCHWKCRVYSESKLTRLSERMKRRLVSSGRKVFAQFHEFVKRITSRFPQDSQIYRSIDLAEASVSDEDNLNDDELAEGSQPTPARPRREIIQNKAAIDLREKARKRLEEQAARRGKVRAEIAKSGLMAGDQTRLIINESKDDEQPFIYINSEIGQLIKAHQIDGVRFMWNQITLDQDARQGCLLAHTMGLGKTMQVITLLVTIAESAASPDSGVRDQIPQDLRTSRTLVICPPSLVDNWMDELFRWAPQGVLGDLSKLDAMIDEGDRIGTIKEWAEFGGVLVSGYRMISNLYHESSEAQVLLCNAPNIVVADEAHYLKNPKTKGSIACSDFRTKTRIAMTGSPLANNVEEYRAMIEWVAPNYLGPIDEFRDIYARPIEHGLGQDSSTHDKRKALTALEALKRTVSPKVHRATIKSCMKETLPPKMEFVLFVPPTELQRQLYELYLEGIGIYSGDGRDTDALSLAQSQLFATLNHLALICNHPRCFRQKVQDIKQGISPKTREEAESNGSFPRAISDKAMRLTNSPDLPNPSFSWKAQLLTLILDESRRLGDKVLVFSQSLSALDYLEQMCKQQRRRVCRLQGNTPVSKRQDMVKDFNAGAQEVYLISTKAGGVGLNIQGANRVVIFDAKWNPVDVQQAIGRAYRIGQQKKVFVYQFVIAGTFEQSLQDKHVFKTQLASRVVDKKNPVSWGKRKGTLVHHILPEPQGDLEEFLGKDEILDKLIQYQTTGNSIRKIMCTDTFEEEDNNETLTKKEQHEVKQLVNLNHLRYSDPQEYLKEKEKLDRELYQGFAAQMAQASPRATLPSSLPVVPVLKSQIGTLVSPQAHAGHLQASTAPPPQESAASLNEATLTHGPNTLDPEFQLPHSQISDVGLRPIAGANTFFSPDQAPERHETTTAIEKPALAQPTRPVPSQQSISQPLPFKGGSIFGAIQGRGKSEFEKVVLEKLQRLQVEAPDERAKELTETIEGIRKPHRYGSVPDEAHWKMLCSLSQQPRFILAFVNEYLAPSYVALSSKRELEERLHTLNSLPDAEFLSMLERGKNSLDPNNLQNLRRPNQNLDKPTTDARANDDIKVMREAADRRRRDTRLPPWANEALQAEKTPRHDAVPKVSQPPHSRHSFGGFSEGRNL